MWQSRLQDWIRVVAGVILADLCSAELIRGLNSTGTDFLQGQEDVEPSTEKEKQNDEGDGFTWSSIRHIAMYAVPGIVVACLAVGLLVALHKRRQKRIETQHGKKRDNTNHLTLNPMLNLSENGQSRKSTRKKKGRISQEQQQVGFAVDHQSEESTEESDEEEQRGTEQQDESNDNPETSERVNAWKARWQGLLNTMTN